MTIVQDGLCDVACPVGLGVPTQDRADLEWPMTRELRAGKGVLNRRISNSRMSKDSEFDRVDRLIDSPSKLDPLIHENDELMSILVVSVKTAKENRKPEFHEIAYEAH